MTAAPGVRSLTRFFVAVAVLAVLAGCSGGTSKADATAKTSNPPGNNPGTTPTPTAEQKAVLAAYYSYWTVFASAANPPDPGSKDLARHAVDPELSKARRALAGWAKDSSLFDGTYSHAGATAAVTESKAVVHDCMTLVGKVIDAATKKVKSETNPQPLTVTADLALVSGKWKVASVHNGSHLCMPASTNAPTSEGRQ
ncbi:MAG: hypothetical protein ACXWBO_00720 [Ilumatobacteraceae bacterium]